MAEENLNTPREGGDQPRVPSIDHPQGFVERIIAFCLKQKLVVALLVLMTIGWGVMVAPFDWDLGGLPRDPVPVDAIPDIGENQQIVFTEWPGRSPQDVEDQVTYPLTVSLLGIPGVKTVRSFSMFGFSSVYVIFEEDIDFYWSRSRVLEKLSSLPPNTLPEGVQPVLGPDATALGQIYWYTLEGRDPEGNPTGGWDLDELRSIQDWYVRYGLLSAGGVSEVASVGGFVREYQIDANPDALRVYDVSLQDLFRAVKMSNLDVGARTIEINNAEYLVRGIGFIENLEDIENAVVAVRDNLPIRVRDVAEVSVGPAQRRGLLDKEGAEVVGGVVVVRYGENPMQAIKNVKAKIEEISPGLPSKVLDDGTKSKVEIVPFYDRAELIGETLGTLNTALIEEILVTIIVVLIVLMHLKSSLIVSSLLPMAVLMCFIAMKQFGVDANIVALSGIAIAIGTMVDMGIVITENIISHLHKAKADERRTDVIFRATSEVGGAVMTAVATTIVSFLPVFAMTGAEGKLFKPLAYTKTFALMASIVVAVTVLPVMARLLLTRVRRKKPGIKSLIKPGLVILAGAAAMVLTTWWLGLIPIWWGCRMIAAGRVPPRLDAVITRLENWVVILVVSWFLATRWLPLGPELGDLRNFVFVFGLIAGLLAVFTLFQRYYTRILAVLLDHKALFLTLPTLVVLLGLMIWLGAPRLTSWLPQSVRSSEAMVSLAETFPGLGKEFMPPLDEGSFLYMPTTMPHASIGEVREVLAQQDMAITAIPEVESAVGKLGRAETPLDPAPVSMIETVINYHSEYLTDESGERLRFKFLPGSQDLFRTPDGEPVRAPDGLPYKVRGRFPRDEDGHLIPDPDGAPFRIWRSRLDPDLNPGREPWPGVTSPDDIWDRIVDAAQVPGVTSAPKLQPIAARIVMLQSGMRAPMGIKVKGPDLRTIERVGLDLERLLKEVPSVKKEAVIADRIVGKPYLEIVIDREAIARYGIMLSQVQEVIEVAVGGKKLTTTVEGRERYPVRVRYMRELRDSPDALRDILVASPATGQQIPLSQLADIEYVRGPQAIKSEDTFLVGYVLFDKKDGFAEVDVVEQAQAYLKHKIDSGELVLPAGVSYEFAGSYKNQVRAQKKLALILPLALLVITIILYLQFQSLPTTLMVFSGIMVAWSGGFVMIWLYGQDWFMHFEVFGVLMRDLFQVQPINLSVAIWVGFLALFGIATDDGVIMATYLDESKGARPMDSVANIRKAIVAGAARRIRPALMTSATTILALLPILTSTGRGADIMVPMAIPSFGGMTFALLTVFVVPVLYCWVEEAKFKAAKRGEEGGGES
ncbi:efflux RND transporter permease subunit [Desulfohalovibrio reitneri]|uniref:efflux RND transporter permease subunit n=1 Tax=Desulfohalovibrio reitneri TaxID=1307759 RepID=UPI0006920AA9|nr:efflux RND transporter permease subunit [Desulfohalovibrio reitneri]